MADNNKPEFPNGMSVYQWLKTEWGQNALKHDSFKLDPRYNKTIDQGKQMYDLKNALDQYAQAAAACGFGNVKIESNKQDGTKIIFRPTDNSIKINDDDCPSLDISYTKDGMQVVNGIPTANNPVFARAASGQVGLASSLSIGITEAAKQLRQYSAGWEANVRNMQERAKKVKTTTRISMDSVTHLNPNVYSKHQIDNYKDSLSAANIEVLRLEAIEVLKNQAMVAHYNHSLFKAHENKMNGFKGAPRTEKQFERELQEILESARGCSTIQELNNYVKNRHPWIYHNVWKGDLENLYGALADEAGGLKIYQGGKKEGAAGIISLKDPDIPFGEFENYGRKTTQNLRTRRKTTPGKSAAGRNLLFTKSQNELYKQAVNSKQLKKEETFEDLYNIGNLTDENIRNAFNKLKAQREKAKKAGNWTAQQEKTFQNQMRDALKGFGKDASIMSRSMAKDFAGMSVENVLKGEVSEQVVLDKIRETLTARAQKQKGKKLTEQEIAQKVNDEISQLENGGKIGTGKNAKSKDDFVKDIISGLYGLDSLQKIQGEMSSYYDSDTKTYKNIKTTQKLDNLTMTIRGGATSDLRSVASAVNDELFALALLDAGYSKKDVYKNGKDLSGGLNVHMATAAEPLSEKTIRSEISKRFQYIITKMKNGGSSEDDIVATFNKTEIGQIVSYDATTGHLIYHPEALTKYLNASSGEGKKTPLDLLKDITKIGQDLGIYQKGEAFTERTNEKNEKYIWQNIKTLGSTEVSVSSGDRYQGLGDETKSRAGFTWRELQSLEGTIGDMQRLGRDEKEIAPLRAFHERLTQEFEDKKKQYEKFNRSYKMMGDTFSNNPENTLKEKQNNIGVKMLSLDDIEKIYTDINFDNTFGYESGIKITDQNKEFVEDYLKRVRKEQYAKLLKTYSKEELQAKNIYSADDIQVGVDIGRTLSGVVNGELLATRGVMLGLGEYEPSDSGLLMPNEVSVNNMRILGQLKRIRGLTGDASSNQHDTNDILHRISSATTDARESIQNGSVWEKYHTLSGDASSGYLLLQGMNEHSDEIYKEILASKNIKSDEVPNMIMSRQDAVAMMLSEYGNDPEYYDNLYKQVAGKKTLRGTDKISRINRILDAIDIDSKNFTGKLDTSKFFNRSPTIKFASDMMGGRLAVTSNSGVVNQGSLMIKRSLAAAGHGDMDGDRVAFFNALAFGGEDDIRAAAAAYFEDIEKEQAKGIAFDAAEDAAKIKALDPGSGEYLGEVNKINSVADIYKQNLRAVGSNAAAKGAGIYGNLLFGVQNILRDKGISKGAGAEGTRNQVFLGEIASNLAHTLYQEGINPKNIKIPGGSEMSAAEATNFISGTFAMASGDKTWDTSWGMSELLGRLEALGTIKSDDVFKRELMANMGFLSLKQGDKKLEFLAEMAEKTRNQIEKQYGSGSDEYKRIQKNIEDINAIKSGAKVGLEKISKELVNALITDPTSGLASVFAKSDKGSFGTQVKGHFKRIPGHGYGYDILNHSNDAWNEEIVKKYPDLFDENGRLKDRETHLTRYGELAKSNIKFAKSEQSTTARLSRFIPGEYTRDGQLPVGVTEVLDLLDKATSGTEDEQKAAKAQLDKRTAANWAEIRPVLKAITTGTLSHFMAEAIAEKSQNPLYQGEEGSTGDNLWKEKFGSARQDQYDTAVQKLQLMKYSKEEAQTLASDALTKGARNAKYLTDRIKRLGGKGIASEAQLVGFTTPDNGQSNRISQTADYLYVTEDENGKKTIHVADYKNVGNGQAKVSNVLQVKDYSESLKLLQEDILASGATDASAYLSGGYNSKLAEQWALGLRDGIEKEMGREGWKELTPQSTAEEREKYNAELDRRWADSRAKFGEIFEALRDANTQFVGELITYSANDVIRRFDVNLNNGGLNEIYKKYINQKDPSIDTLTEAEKERILKDSNIISKNDEVYAGTKKEFEHSQSQEIVNQFIGPLEDILTKRRQIEENNAKIRVEGREIRPSDETIASLRAKNAELEASIGSKGDYEKAQKLQEELNQLSSEGAEADEKRAKLLKEINELKQTQYYKLGEIKERLLKEQGANLEGEALTFAEDRLDATVAGLEGMIKKDINGSTRKKIKSAEYDATVGQFKTNAKEMRSTFGEIVKLENELKKEGLTEEQRFDLQDRKTIQEEYYKELEQNRQKLYKTLGRKEVQNEDGTTTVTWKKSPTRKDNTAYLNAYDFTEMRKNAVAAELAPKAPAQPKQIQRPYYGGGMGDFFGFDAATIRWVDRLMQGGALMKFVGMLRKGLSQVIQEAKALDKAMTNLRIVTNDTASNTKTLMNSYAKLGKELGATTLEITNSATEWLRQGYEAVDVTKLITASMYLSKLGMIDSATATKDLTSAMKGFKMEASEAMSIVDKLTAIDLKAATSAGEIAEGLSQFANLATLSGVNIDQAAAYVATIADVTQNSGSQVGASMKTIISRYGNVKAGAYNKLNTDDETSETSENLNDVERVLHKLNIDIRDSNLNFKDFDVVLDEIAEKWGTLDNVSKKAIANAFAGVRQQESFVTLMENYDKYQSLLETSENSSGTAETKYQSYKESYEAAQNTLKSTIQELVNNSDLNVILTDVTKFLAKLIEGLERVIKILPGFLASFEATRALFGKSMLQTAGYHIKDFFNGKGNRAGFFDSRQWKESGANHIIGAAKNSEWVQNRQFDKELRKEYRRNLKIAKGDKSLTDALRAQHKKNKDDLSNERKAKRKSLTQRIQEAKDKRKAEHDKKELEREEKKAKLSEKMLKNKEQEAKAGEEEKKSKDQVNADGKSEASGKQDVVDKGKQEANEKQDVVDKGRQEANEKGSGGVAQVDGSGEAGESGKSGKSGKSGGGSQMSAVLGAASVLSSGIMAGITGFQTGAATHMFNGKQVDSSEEAVARTKGLTAAGGLLSAIPIVGGFVNMIFQSEAEKLAAKIDKERDSANAATERASKIISGLEEYEGKIESLGDYEFGSVESQKEIDNLLKDLYSEDGEETRKVLEQYLGDDIYSVLTKIKDNTEESAEAYRQLQIAELQAKKEQVGQKYANAIYNNSVAEGKAYSAYDNYTAKGVGNGELIGNSIGGFAAGAGLGAAAMGTYFAVAGSNAWNPVGWVMLGIGALVGTGFGIAAGIKAKEAKEEEARAKHAREAAWAQLSTTEKIAQVTNDMNAAMKNGDSKVVGTCQELLSVLKQQNALTNQIINEINEITAQQGAIAAYIVGSDGKKSYLTDMTTAQLKEVGLDEILLSYARGLDENGGLIGRNVWTDESKTALTESGYDYLRNLLGKQGDDEINAVLGGKAYSLNEVLKLRQKFGDQRWINEILESFASALNIPIDLLEQMQNRYGELNLNEMMMSTADLSDTIEKYSNLLGEVASGTGDVSSWMATVIDQFPDLIAYMSDLPALFSKVGAKLQQLSRVYVQSQFEDVASSEGFFETIKDDFYNALSEGAAETLKGLGGTGATSISSVLSWLKTQYGADGQLTDDGAEVLKKLKETVDQYGVEITSSVLKTYYDQLIDFKTQTLDKQLSNLNEQKEALQQINSQREYENKLIEAKLKLENASKEKKRVYRAGVGWVYESDQAAIKEAQENLTQIENEKTVSALEQQIAELEHQKTELEQIYDEENYETLSKLYDAFVDQAEKDGSNASTANGFLEAMKEGIDGISVNLSELLQNSSDQAGQDKEKALAKAKEAWENLQQAAASGSAQDYNTALDAYHSAANAAKQAGATKDDMSSWGTANTGDAGSTSQGAWETAEGDQTKQQKSVKLAFRLNDVGYPDQKYWEGTVDLSRPEYNSTVLNDYILGDIRKGRASIYPKSGEPFNVDKNDIRYQPKKDEDFMTYANRMRSEQNLSEVVYIGWDGGKEAIYYLNGQAYTIRGEGDGDKIHQEKGAFPGRLWAESAQTGSLGLMGGTSLINELGTEAIITPQGTLTALPSKTGIVPADVTKNLWALGEVAPSIMRVIQAHIAPDTIGKSSIITSNDDSFNIDNLTMHVNADNTFDADAFVDSIKSRIALTRNLKR